MGAGDFRSAKQGSRWEGVNPCYAWCRDLGMDKWLFGFANVKRNLGRSMQSGAWCNRRILASVEWERPSPYVFWTSLTKIRRSPAVDVVGLVGFLLWGRSRHPCEEDLLLG